MGIFSRFKIPGKAIQQAEEAIAERAPMIAKMANPEEVAAAEQLSKMGISVPSSAVDQVPEGLATGAAPMEAAAANLTPAEAPISPQSFKDWLTNEYNKTSTTGKAVGAATGIGLLAALYNSFGQDAPPKQQVMTPIPSSEIDQNQTSQDTKERQQQQASETAPGPRRAPATATAGSIGALGSQLKQNSDINKDLADLTSGQPSVNSAENLRNALQMEQDERFTNQLASAGAKVGAAIAGVRPDTEYFDKAAQESKGRYTGMLDQFSHMEERDPKSKTSVEFRDFLKKYGFNAPEGMSAAKAREVLPYVYKSFENEQQRENQKDLMKYKYAELNAMKQAQAQKVGDDKATKRFDKLGKELTAETASSRSAFGRAANNRRSAEAILTLVDQYKHNPNEMNDAQMAELARNLDALLSQGQPSISGTQKLIPSTARGDIAKTIQYLRGIPVGAQQKEFVKRMVETVNREKDLAGDQIRRTQGKIIGSYKDLQKSHPDQWQELMQAHGLDVGEETDSIKKQADKINEIPHGQEIQQGDDIFVKGPDGSFTFSRKASKK